MFYFAIILLFLIVLIDTIRQTRYVYLIKIFIFFLLLNSGGCFGQRVKRTIVGGWAFAWTCVTDVQS